MNAVEVRRHVGGNHRALDQKCAHTAHRVSQRSAFSCHARPARTNQDGCCKVFLERRSALLQAIAALVQAAA